VADDLLRRDVRFLADMLGAVIRDSEGEAAVALVEEIRSLSRDRRAGKHEAEPTLAARIASLDEGQARLVTRALSVFFDLVNIAEDRQRVRVLRDRERLGHPQPPGESLAAGIQELAGLGRSATEVQGWLDRLHVELVFTAHPSEAKRRSIRAKLRRMRRGLRELDRDDLLPRGPVDRAASLGGRPPRACRAANGTRPPLSGRLVPRASVPHLRLVDGGRP